MDYFFSKIDRIFDTKYEPTLEDTLKCRARTTGLIGEKFMINNIPFSIFDAGGQRTERRKWIQLFEGVTAIIFVAALNHFCTVLFEDEAKNAMLESLLLFEEIANIKWFKKTEMILFLNKNDLFRERIKDGTPLSVCFNRKTFVDQKKEYFEEYKGAEYVANADDEKADLESLNKAHAEMVYFIQRQYEKRSLNPLKRIFVHVTTATNKENVKKVFWDVQNIVINSNLRKGGLV